MLVALNQMLQIPLQRFGEGAERSFHIDLGDKEYTLHLKGLRKTMSTAYQNEE